MMDFYTWKCAICRCNSSAVCVNKDAEASISCIAASCSCTAVDTSWVLAAVFVATSDTWINVVLAVCASADLSCDDSLMRWICSATWLTACSMSTKTDPASNHRIRLLHFSVAI